MEKNNVSKENNYDFIIIGAGVTGMAAAMYAARLELKTLCLGASSGTELPIGGVITTTNIVENYPGFIKLTGEELAEAIKKHALSYDNVQIKNERVGNIEKTGEGFVIKTKKNENFGKTILFATGTKWKKLEVPGAMEYEGKGINFCALCDGFLYKNKVVAIIGGSDSAAKDALVLTEHAKKVYIIYRKEKIRAEPVNMKRVEGKIKIGKLEIVNNTKVVEIKGGKSVKSVVLDREFNGSKELFVDGVFVAIGHIALSDFAKALGVKLNEKGEIMIDHKTSETNINGVYAAGDVADKPFKQAITGVAEGCTAAYSAFEYINKKNI